MLKKVAFIVYYEKQNFQSFNALIGALETQKDLEDIKIYFMRGKANLLDKIEQTLQTFEVIILGFSFFTTQLWDIKDLIQKINKKYNGKLIKIAGGPHPTGAPFSTLKMGFDVVVVGEGEETIIEIMRRIIKNEDLTNVKGIAYLDKEKNYHFTGRRLPLDLNTFPPLPFKHEKFGPIEITRGCPYVCYFCQTPYIFGTKPRHRSIDSICNAVKFMIKDHNKKDILLMSPDAFSYGSPDGKKLNLIELEDLIKRVAKIIEPDGRLFFGTFPSEVRPEHVINETLDLVKKYASNEDIVIGAQSGSQHILDLCNRGHTVGDIFKAIQLTNEYNLKAIVDFIFGLPFQEEDDVNLTIEVMKELTKMGARIHMHSFLPLPQTVFASMDVKKMRKKIRKSLHELSAHGQIFGEWQKQEEMALKIAKYLKTKKIK